MPRQDRAEKVSDHQRLAIQRDHRQAQAEAFRQRYLDAQLARMLRRIQEALDDDDLPPQPPR